MNTIAGSQINYQIKRAGIFLTIVALIAGAVGCEPAPGPQHNLTIANTAGGEVTMPGEGTFTYNEGTAVSLIATPDGGYRFVNWTGDVGTVGGIDSAATTITIDDSYSITANFVAQYVLTIDSTEGGDVVSPGEGTFTYDCGTVVDAVAEAEEGYQFLDWTGDVANIGDIDAASTAITMNGDYTITARFAREVHTWHDLDAVRDDLSGHYLLMNELDIASDGYDELADATAYEGRGWQPVGTRDDPFVGSFHGQGYEISDLFIKRPGEDCVGLFGAIREGAVIRNIGVTSFSVTGGCSVGALVGWSCGTVRGSHSSGSVTGDLSVGGLVGLNARGGMVRNSCSESSVTGHGEVGGLVGTHYYGTLSYSYSRGVVIGDSYVGGLVGSNLNLGGIVSYCFWDVETSGMEWSAGGDGRTTPEMWDITTFSGAGWDIVAVATGETNPAYTWNIVDGEAYPFLSWQAVS